MTIGTPSKIVCVGKNYLDHAREMGSEIPDEPLLFLKPPSALIGPDDPIVIPALSSHVEHEAEIAIVIKTRLQHASEEAAIQGIAGFVCLNDVTARDSTGGASRCSGGSTVPSGSTARPPRWRSRSRFSSPTSAT